jgi:hypothetical protein
MAEKRLKAPALGGFLAPWVQQKTYSWPEEEKKDGSPCSRTGVSKVIDMRAIQLHFTHHGAQNPNIDILYI